MGREIFWNYLPEATGYVCMSTELSDFDTVLAVYDGCCCPVEGNSLLACNDDEDPDKSVLTSFVDFDVVEGNCYKIQVGGFGSSVGVGIPRLILIIGVPNTIHFQP